MAWRPVSSHRSSILSLAPRSAFSSHRASLSPGTDDKSQKVPPHKQGPGAPTSQNPSYPTFSFQDLGANRTVKVVVIVCLTVLGTMESIFWVQVLWAKISPPSPSEEISEMEGRRMEEHDGKDQAELCAISSDLLANLNLYSEFTAAAYCASNSNLTNGFADPVTCYTGNCPSVPADTMTLYEFENSLLTDVTGYLSTTPSLSLLTLSFRGSKSIRNFIADANFVAIPTDICPGCTAHQGFWKSWLEARKGILAALTVAVAQNPSYRIVVTGHSLGGAIAQLAVADIRNKGLVGAGAALYTYGSPRVGNKALADYVTAQAGGNFRVTHTDDPVPRLPPIVFGYRHVSPEYWVTAPTGVEPGTGDVQVLSGSANLMGNAGTLGFNVDAHGWYLGPVSACSPKGFEFKD
ncbi:hypothetical protein MMC24_002187 [Lignoscripta atroalba]|nr:hypothetical protein [Lignoscripta atroalba]